MKDNTGFKDYLKAKGMASGTRKSWGNQVANCLLWLNCQGITAPQASYNDLLGYLRHCQNKGNTQATQQKAVTGLRHYYNYLIAIGEAVENPAQHIEVKGVKRKHLYNILEAHELASLYQALPHSTTDEITVKTVAGLLVFQGLTKTEIVKLELQDVDPMQGTITIHQGRQYEGRTLILQPLQIMGMHTYITIARESLLQQKACPPDGGNEACNRLFVNPMGSSYYAHLMEKVIKSLRVVSPKVESTKQIRASVIVKWLRAHNLRKAQYMAGHRYVSSTEKYQDNDIETLKQEIEQYHPLG